MFVEILLLIIGFVILIYSAERLVEGASSLAVKLGVSAFVIGLTVVAFGTSMPEMFVNLLAAMRGNTELAIGNIVGSNTINIFLVVGIAAIVRPINVQSLTIKLEIPFSFLAAVILFILANDVLIDGKEVSILSRTEGMVLLTFLALFLYYTYFSTKSGKYAPISSVKERKWVIASLMIIFGIGGLYLGGRLIVDSASTIARSLGVPDSIIGLTVVALGTSLPELVTSAVAAYKGNADIAIGNVLGSNIFNIFMVLGVSSLISPLPLYPHANIDIMVTCLASLLLFTFALIGPGQKIDRREGIILVSIYLVYLAYLAYSI